MTDPARGSREWSARATLRVALVVLAAASVLSIAGIFLHSGGTGPTATELWGTGLGAGALVATILGLRAVDKEVRERLRVSQDLLAAERRYASILNIAADAIITIDESHHIIDFNHGAEQIFGWSSAEMLGRPLGQLIPERFRRAHDVHIGDFAESPQVARRMSERQEIFGLRRDGTEFNAEASISQLDAGGRRLFTVVLRDISLRRRRENDARFLARAGQTVGASLDYESTLLSAVHLGVPYLADCCVMNVLEEGTGMRRVVSVHDDPDITKRLRAFESRPIARSDWPFPVASVMSGDRVITRMDLSPDWARAGAPDADQAALVESLGIRSMMTVPLDARGRVIGALTFLVTDAPRDYGPEREAVARSLVKLIALAIDNAWLYRAAQRASLARDEILGVVSHDLRNPLAAVAMSARRLLDLTGTDGTASLAQVILESTGLMSRLISDLHDVAMIESGHLTVHPDAVDLPPLLDHVLSMAVEAARERGITLSATVAGGIPPLHADEGRLAQVLANLIGNAIKFTDRGGHVAVDVVPNGREATLAVQDSGHGIAAEDLPHIFDRYWHARRRSRTSGSGLGLAIARGIVEAHGGRLWVESVPGRGSTFYFTMPLAGRGGTTSTGEPAPAAPHVPA